MQNAQAILVDFHECFDQQAARLCTLTNLAQKVKTNTATSDEVSEFETLGKQEETIYQKLMTEIESVESAINDLPATDLHNFEVLVQECRQHVLILRNPDFAVSRKPKDVFG